MCLRDFRYSAARSSKESRLCDSSDTHDRARRRREHVDLHRRKRRSSEGVLVSGHRASGCGDCASKSLSDVGVSYPDYLDW